MGTITLPNFRVSGTDRARVRLKDGGVYVEWSTMTDIKAWLYSVEQKAISGRFDVRVDPQDGTRLVCVYSAQKPQYLGVNKIILQCKYEGAEKAYDKPLWNFVRWTDDQAGEEITIDDPEVDVEIVAEDMSSSVLDEATAAALAAADRAEAAAEEAEHMVEIHRGPAGKSPYKGENGNWFEWDEEAGQYVDTGVRAKGDTGDTPDISIGTVTTVEPGEPAAASMSGTPEAPVLNLSIPKGLVGATPNFTVGTVTTGEPGTPVVVTLTGTAEAPVLNITIPQGMQGNTGSSVDYPFELVNNLTTNDATKALSAAQGVVLDGKISQLQQELNDISNTEAVDTDEEIKVISEDGQTTILEITEDGVDAKNLKSNGFAVLTSHQGISGLATKTELEEGLAEKQDIIEELSIGEDMPASFTRSEMDFSSDDESEVYARVDENGISAKGFRLLSGETLKADPLGGKKWAVLGDSFTEGATNNRIPDGQYAGKRKVYPYFIGNRTGMNVLNTFFASGRTLAFPATPGDFTNSICNPSASCYYQNIPADVDYITIYLGINDSHHSPGSEGGDGEDNTGEIPIGTISDNTTATYYGAWNVVLTWLRTNRPFAHIGIIVSNGCDEMAYRTAQIAVAKKYGIPYLDLNGDERCPAMIRPQNDDIPSAVKTILLQTQSVDYDGTQTGTINRHPNDAAHLFESHFIENFLRTI